MMVSLPLGIGSLEFGTLILYSFLGVFCMICIKKACVAGIPGERKVPGAFWFALFFSVMAVFAVFRNISVGADFGVYKEFFDTIDSGSLISERLKEYKSGYFWLTYFCKKTLGSFNAYIFVCYAIMLLGYIVFMSTYCKRPDALSFIPFLIVAYFYIKALTELKTALSASCFLIFLSCLKPRKPGYAILGLVFLFLSLELHLFTIAAFAPFVIFWYLFRDRISGWSRIKFVLWIIIPVALSLAVIRYVKGQLDIYAPLYDLIRGDIRDYLQMSATNVWQGLVIEHWIMLIPHGALFVFMLIFWKELGKSRSSVLAKAACTWDIMIMPACTYANVWRENSILFMTRIMMWAEIVRIIEKHCPEKRKKLLKILAFLVFFGWFLFRIFSEAQDLGVDTYVFDFSPK